MRVVTLPDQAELKLRFRVVALWGGKEQRELAEDLGVPYATLRNYFTAGRPGPPLDKALKLADLAGVPRDFVLLGWDAVTPAPAPDPDLERRIAAIEAQLNGQP